MATDKTTPIPPLGVYNIEYFSGSQCAVYIGDVWVDEITSMSYNVSQSRTPLYGYADTLFRSVSKGQRIVQGAFTINFKEAGYLWLILNRYQEIMLAKGSVMRPLKNSDTILRQNIERIVDGETSTFERNEKLSALAQEASLTGFASNQRLLGKNDKGKTDLGKAENAFEAFENHIWQDTNEELDLQDRSPDDYRLNKFDIYVAFGDFAGDDRNNHTIQKLTDVHIVSSGKQIAIDGMPIQEEYQFIARNLV